MKTGRQQSIPEFAYDDVRRWRAQGYGCRKIVKLLEGLGIYTGKSSVDRLLRGQPPYGG